MFDPVVRFPCVEFSHRDVDGSTSQLRRKIYLLSQVPAACGQIVQTLARCMQRDVFSPGSILRLVPFSNPRRYLGSERLKVGRERSLRRGEFLPRLPHRVRVARLSSKGFSQLGQLAERPFERQELPGRRLPLHHGKHEVALHQTEEPFPTGPDIAK